MLQGVKAIAAGKQGFGANEGSWCLATNMRLSRVTKGNWRHHLATNPIHGPFHPRRPDTIITRMIRGMVPKRKPSGIQSFKRLRVYIGVPEELKTQQCKRSMTQKSPGKNHFIYRWVM